LLNGYDEGYNNGIILLFGPSEFTYFKKINSYEPLTQIEIPLIIFSDGSIPDARFVDFCDAHDICVTVFNLTELEIKKLFLVYLEDKFAPQAVLHGDFIEVFGVGILITGNSGIGKSETTLELIHRGHRLIVDDLVTIKKMSGNFLFGYGSKIAPHFMEIRGVGIIDISKLYGIGVVRDKKRVELQVHLEEWDKKSQYDRTGLLEKSVEILGLNIPYILLPIKPGRNIPTIIETAAMNYRLRKMGVNSVVEMNQKLKQWLKLEKITNKH